MKVFNLKKIIIDQIEILVLIGEGTYGQVLKGKIIKSLKIAPIEKFKESDQENENLLKTVLKEIRVLKEF